MPRFELHSKQIRRFIQRMSPLDQIFLTEWQCTVSAMFKCVEVRDYTRKKTKTRGQLTHLPPHHHHHHHHHHHQNVYPHPNQQNTSTSAKARAAWNFFDLADRARMKVNHFNRSIVSRCLARR